jgi:hypothetical protein
MNPLYSGGRTSHEEFFCMPLDKIPPYGIIITPVSGKIKGVIQKKY